MSGLSTWPYSVSRFWLWAMITTQAPSESGPA